MEYQVLEARDKRVHLIDQLIKSKCVILSLRINYPGYNKDHLITRKIIEVMDNQIENQFEIEYKHFLNDGEGYVVVYILSSTNPIKIKKLAIDLEEHHPLGRLVDIDVYYESIKSISRKDLNMNSRKCFLCNQDAFICIRYQSHTQEELVSYIKRVVDQYER